MSSDQYVNILLRVRKCHQQKECLKHWHIEVSPRGQSDHLFIGSGLRRLDQSILISQDLNDALGNSPGSTDSNPHVGPFLLNDSGLSLR